MHRIDGPGATVDNKFTDGDPVGGVQATMVTDDWLNDVQENIMAVLTAAGVTPTKGRAADLLDSIKKAVPGRRINTQVLTVSGTYTRSAGVSFIIVRAVGGGGAGGGSAATSAGQCAAGGGGASGAYAEGIFASPPATVAVTVGSAGVPMNGNAPGGNGGSTVFGALMTCPGGPGGLGAPATATGGASISGANSGNSLSPTGGNIIGVAGQAGENGLALNTSAAGSGGSSPLGAGGNSPVAVGGRPASGYGAGGSGSNSPSNTPASQAGGAGTPGIVIVEEYA